jgi:predicted ATP-dependent endonuclease of OLD family
MKLQKIEIENYRSIKKLEFVFEPRCRVLVGINESGKSNILHALSHLDPDVKVSAHDLREAGRDEDGNLKGRIWFRFQLEDIECEEVTSELAKLMFGIDAKLGRV